MTKSRENTRFCFHLARQMLWNWNVLISIVNYSSDPNYEQEHTEAPKQFKRAPTERAYGWTQATIVLFKTTFDCFKWEW